MSSLGKHRFSLGGLAPGTSKISMRKLPLIRIATLAGTASRKTRLSRVKPKTFPYQAIASSRLGTLTAAWSCQNSIPSIDSSPLAIGARNLGATRVARCLRNANLSCEARTGPEWLGRRRAGCDRRVSARFGALPRDVVAQWVEARAEPGR